MMHGFIADRQDSNREPRMAITSPPPDNPQAFCTEFTEAVIRIAIYHADLVGHFLKHIGFLPPKRKEPIYLPPEFLVELAAILHLAMWEQGELRDSLPADLPPASKALAALADRAAAKVPQFSGEPEAALLLRRVLAIWLSRMAWHGPHRLGADVIVTGTDEDQFATLIAEFLWKHRQTTMNEARHEEA
jgi:hypothetical protein